MKVTKLSQNAHGTTLHIASPSRRYMDEFICLKCAPDLLAAKVFPNSKEVTESMAAFNAVRRELGATSFGDRNITLLDVACGARPRTAALFACRTKWNTIAVDPILKADKSISPIKRVEMRQCKIEETRVGVEGLLVITAVHAHVKLETILSSCKAPNILLIAMPCCQPLFLPSLPDKEYEDYGCWSPERTVKIWRL